MQIKRIFNIVSVITSLHWSKLRGEILQWLVMIVKSWSNNACEGCLGGNLDSSLSNFLTFRKSLIDENAIIIEEEDVFEDDPNY